MPRILIDLTDMEWWRGPHAGTQRVAYNIAKNFYLRQNSLELQLRFITFSARDKKYRFTTFDPLYKRVEALNQSGINGDSPAQHSVKARLKSYLDRYAPERVKALLRKPADLLGRSRILLEGYPWKGDADSAEVTFRAQDILLILGKPWDNPDIQTTLGNQRAEVKFRLVQVVYDLIICLYPHLHHPNLFEPYTKNMREAIMNSDLLLPISESSARDLTKFCKQHNLKEQ